MANHDKAKEIASPPSAMMCDMCDRPAVLVVSSILDRKADFFCWPCLMAVAANVAATFAAQEESEPVHA